MRLCILAWLMLIAGYAGYLIYVEPLFYSAPPPGNFLSGFAVYLVTAKIFSFPIGLTILAGTLLWHPSLWLYRRFKPNRVHGVPRNYWVKTLKRGAMSLAAGLAGSATLLVFKAIRLPKWFTQLQSNVDGFPMSDPWGLVVFFLVFGTFAFYWLTFPTVWVIADLMSQKRR